jgi:RNA polymerase sigma-70 factor (ECF subfamily)
MHDTQKFSVLLVDELPVLRRRAVALSQNKHLSEDLVQTTVLKAWEHRDRFQENTCLRAWLFTILRNTFISGIRKKSLEVADIDSKFSALVMVAPAQDDALMLKDLLNLVNTLPRVQRTALLLMGAEGYSQQEAADICKCSLGTIKSRVSRARATLSQLMLDRELSVDLRSAQSQLASFAAAPVGSGCFGTGVPA